MANAYLTMFDQENANLKNIYVQIVLNICDVFPNCAKLYMRYYLIITKQNRVLEAHDNLI